MMKELIESLVNRVDKLTEAMSEYNTILARLTVTIEEHERRSTQFEEYVKDSEVRVQKQLEPVQRHVIQVRAIIAFLGFVFGGGIGTAILLYLLNRN